MHTCTVQLGDRSYPIHIGRDLLRNATLLQPHIKGRALIVTSQAVSTHYLEPLRNALGLDPESAVVLPDGEEHKTLTAVNRIIDQLLRHRYDRETAIIALGGGVTGDIAGFAAACYQRGVPFLQVPTTLLAQVDSSVGGKTGVNHELGKNMIGAFHQPQCVIADTATLDTLPDRELRSGLAEVIKYGLIIDAQFFAWLEQNATALLQRDPQALAHAITVSCESKARVVAGDEREHGRRAILNLGHTFGHAIETETEYRAWTHGEAVAAGMALAAEFSVRLGWLSEQDRARCVALLESCGLPVRPPPMPVDRFLQHMSRDKKARGSLINLVLLRGIGEATVTHDYDNALLTDMLQSHA